MANELVHATQGTELFQAEYESITAHILNSQATGDMIYASSATQLSRLAIGATDTLLSVVGGVPTWVSEINNITLDTAVAKGTWTASGTWTLPAFTAGGNIALNGKYLSGDGGNEGILVDSSGNVTSGPLDVSGSITLSADVKWTSAAGSVQTQNVDDAVIRLYARDNGVGLVEVGKILSAADPYVKIGNLTALYSGNVGIGTTAPGALLDLGLAGTTAGVIRFAGVTSGNVTVAVAAVAGSWTMTLPTGVAGVGGYQLTDAAGNGVCSWTAAGSKREWKNILDANFAISPSEALDRILSTKVYPFTFKPGFGTGDTDTIYQGPMADESPWAMHHDGGILNPITSFGYMILAIQALESRIKELERSLV